MKIFASSLAFAFLSISASHAEPLDVFRDCDTCPEMVELPMGSFIMGAPDDEFRRGFGWNGHTLVPPSPEFPDRDKIDEDEGPQHKVTIDIRIAMGRNEITFDEWMVCVNDGSCGGYIPDDEVGQWGTDEAVIRALTDPRFKHIPSEANIARAVGNPSRLQIGGRYPVLYVSYLDAQAYTAWLNQKLGTDAYRLPSEAEWEYAARAGTTTRFAQGFEPTPDQANISAEFTELVMMKDRPDLRNLGYPVLVDELDAANPWGLRHMSGNAGEWTLSCYIKRYAGWSRTREWLEKSFGPSCERTVRGGSFNLPMDAARVAWRNGREETARTSFYGFRVVKELD